MSYHITKRVIRIYVIQHYIISYHPLHILAFYLQKVQIFHLPDSNYLRLTEILEYVSLQGADKNDGSCYNPLPSVPPSIAC